ncbi:MAG: DUF1972 domain-containing protein, partial [Bacteroidia bacterium]
MKKLAIIGTVGVPANYGGFETLAEQLVINLDEDYDLTVYCSREHYYQQPSHYKNAKLVYLSLNANGVQSILYDIVSIFHAVRRSEVLLILGVSGAVCFPFIRLFYPKIKLITNIDGIEWKRAKWNRIAKWYLKFSEKIAVKYSHRVIADNRMIVEYVNETYHIDSELIEYGVEHSHTDSEISSGLPEGSYDIAVCRIEPENNVHVILEAYSKVNSFKLVFIGNWEANEYARKLKERFGKFPNIMLIHSIYDLEELNRYRKFARLYVHGHSAGGTNPSLVEAMYLNLPVAAFDVNYNRETTENKCLYFKNADELSGIITQTPNEQLDAIADELHRISLRRYSWTVIARKYRHLLDGERENNLNANLKVSIITVVYQNKKSVKDAIESVLSQSYKN